MTSSAPLGCVLAGGQSSRMGRDKAMLLFQGRTLIEHAVERLRDAGCHVWIAGTRPDLAQYAPIVNDLHPGSGPLGGIEAALSAAAPGASVLFLPVDLPLLPARFLTFLLERADHTGALATIPLAGARPQPLCAVYRRALLPGITRALDAGERKVLRVVEAITSESERDFFAVESALTARGDLLAYESVPLYRWFQNINTPGDWSTLGATVQH